jgi:hypothetical protein
MQRRRLHRSREGLLRAEEDKEEPDSLDNHRDLITCAAQPAMSATTQLALGRPLDGLNFALFWYTFCQIGASMYRWEERRLDSIALFPPRPR